LAHILVIVVVVVIVMKTSREVEFLATLSHPHVVRYYDNWMELKEAGPSVAAGDAGACHEDT